MTFGGRDGNGRYHTRIYTLKISSNAWTTEAATLLNLPVTRTGCGLVGGAGGRVLLFGGRSDAHVEVFDLKTRATSVAGRRKPIA